MKFGFFVTYASLHHVAAVDWGFRQQQRKTELAYGYEVQAPPEGTPNGGSSGGEAEDSGCDPPTGNYCTEQRENVKYNGYDVDICPDKGTGDPYFPAEPMLEIQKNPDCDNIIDFKVIQSVKAVTGGIITTDNDISHINVVWENCEPSPKCDAHSTDDSTDECTKFDAESEGQKISAGTSYPQGEYYHACCVDGIATIKVQFNDGQFTNGGFSTCNPNFSCGGKGPTSKNAEFHFKVDCESGSTPNPTSPTPVTPNPTTPVTPNPTTPVTPNPTTPVTPNPTTPVTPNPTTPVTPNPTTPVTPKPSEYRTPEPTKKPTPQPTGDCVQPDSKFDPNCQAIFPLGSDTKENDPMLKGATIFYNLERVETGEDRDGTVGEDIALKFSVNNFFENQKADIWVEYLSIVKEEGQWVKKQVCNSTMDDPYCYTGTEEGKPVKVFEAACVQPYHTPKEEWWAYTGINVVYRSPGAKKIDGQDQDVPCCCKRDSDIDRSEESEEWVYVKYSYAILCGCPPDDTRDELGMDPLADHHFTNRSLEEGEEDEPGKDDCESED